MAFKKELRARIEELERRVALLEAPNVPSTWVLPTTVAPATPDWDVLTRATVWLDGTGTYTWSGSTDVRLEIQRGRVLAEQFGW